MNLTKEIRMLEVLANCNGLTRLDALQHSDSCLNTTVSKLSSKYQLTFEKTKVEIPNRFGGNTKFLRYGLSGEQRELALSIVKRCRDQLAQESVKKKRL